MFKKENSGKLYSSRSTKWIVELAYILFYFMQLYKANTIAMMNNKLPHREILFTIMFNSIANTLVVEMLKIEIWMLLYILTNGKTRTLKFTLGQIQFYKFACA